MKMMKSYKNLNIKRFSYIRNKNVNNKLLDYRRIIDPNHTLSNSLGTLYAA
jgi:hypothetical protein